MALNDKQLKAIEERARPDNYLLSNADIADKCKMHRVTFWRLIQKPEAQELLRRVREHYTSLARPRVIAAMEKLAIGGDVTAQRAYLQYTGDIGTGGHVSNINVTQTNNTDESLDDAITRAQLERRNNALQIKE